MNKIIFKKIFNLTVYLSIAQMILVITMPLVTRLYSPHAFAYFGYSVTLVTIFLPLTSLQYEYAIPLVKINLIKHLIIKLCIYLVMGITIFLSILCLSLIYYTHYHISIILFFFTFSILLLQGFLQVYSMWLITEGKANQVAYGKLLQNIIMIFTQIILALFYSCESYELLLGLIAGLLINLIYYKGMLLHDLVRVKLTKRRLFFLLKKNYQLPLYTSWAMFIESSSTLMPILFIGFLYGAKYSGLYFLVYRVFNAPIALLNNAISKILLKELGDRIKDNLTIATLFNKTSLLLGTVSICYLIFLWGIADYMPIIFGKEWIETVAILKILAPIIAISLCISPLSSIFILLKSNVVDSYWQILYLSSTLILIYFYRNEPFFSMLIYLCGLWLALYTAYWFLIYKVVSIREKKLCAE